MGDYYAEIAEGGALWFTNLAAADPTYNLPFITAGSFLLMTELNSHGVQPSDQVHVMCCAQHLSRCKFGDCCGTSKNSPHKFAVLLRHIHQSCEHCRFRMPVLFSLPVARPRP
jgi:hypothetical protein